MFLADHIWNTRVDHLPTHRDSARWIAFSGGAWGQPLHEEFIPPAGIPYVIVSGSQPRVAISFAYADESDPPGVATRRYPVPPNPPTEAGSDRHVLVLDKDACVLYEIFNAQPQPDGSWRGGSGSIFDLTASRLRPDGWTSADAAGLPILPGLLRYDEAAVGEITHALRFTLPRTSGRHIWPARHHAQSNWSPDAPPMGMRVRLKASVDIGWAPPIMQVVLTALKRYGMILADNGGEWFITGVPDSRWNPAQVSATFARIRARDFEVVDVSGLILTPDSGQVRP